jgi:hypothetical protein
MPSISKSQADLLSSDFLDSLGGDKEDFQPKESLSTLLKLGAGLVEKAQDNLIKSNSIAKGELSASLTVEEPIQEGKRIRVDVSMLKYGLYINGGVKGTKSGSGEFSFKTSFPSKKMVDSIREWIKQAGLKSTNVKKSISKYEKKNKSLAELDSAYAVARSIKMHGIKRTGFLSKAISETKTIAKIELGQAFKLDVIRSLPKNLSDL